MGEGKKCARRRPRRVSREGDIKSNIPAIFAMFLEVTFSESFAALPSRRFDRAQAPRV